MGSTTETALTQIEMFATRKTCTYNELWAYISDGLNTIFKTENRIPPLQYMDYFSVIFNYCTRQLACTLEKSINTDEHKVDFLGNIIYDSLNAYIKEYTNERLEELRDLTGITLLQKYLEIWSLFQFRCSVTNGMFSYLNKHWIRREIDEGKHVVYEVFNLCLVNWLEIIVNTLSQNISSAILNLIEEQRNGNEITSKLISDIEIRIDEERERCDLLLHKSTQEELGSRLNAVLITEKLNHFYENFIPFINGNQPEDLSRMYSLCTRVSNALEHLMKLFEDHVKNTCLLELESIAATAFNDPEQYVSTLLKLYDTFQSFVDGPFKNNEGFQKAMDIAMTLIINKNAVTQMDKKANALSKSPELLARYCDLLLRKNIKTMDEDKVERVLDNTMIIFKFLEDKDIFQKFYARALAKRVVSSSSANDEAESGMLCRIKAIYGLEYTMKLQTLFTDSKLSKDTSAKFKEVISHCNLLLKISESRSGSVWPFARSPSFDIPEILQNCVNTFTKYYSKNHNGRKLDWLLGMSKGELFSTALNKRGDKETKYTFVASTMQMAILLHFNQQLKYDLNQLCALFNSEKRNVVPHIQSLVKAQLLIARNTENEKILPTLEIDTENASVELNLSFKSKSLKTDLSKIVIKSEAKREVEEISNSIENERKFVIEAAIVRVMKTRKTLRHTQLITEIIEQLKSRFLPQIPLIKKCIESLIERGYIKRSDTDRDMYEYLA